jgi:pilus assembly protein CpaF
VHSQVSSALQAVIHLVRGPDGRRRISEVRVIGRSEDGHATTLPAVRFVADGKLELCDGASRFTKLLAGAA